MKKKVLILGDMRSKSRFVGDEFEFFHDVDPTVDGPFDFIVLDHIIPQAKRSQVFPIIQLYANNLKEDGQLILVVPSLEWACKEIAKNEEPNPMAYISLYGSDAEPFACGMTLMWMRLVAEGAGLYVTKAGAEWYKAQIDDQPFDAQQNVLVAVKPAVDTSPANAIEWVEDGVSANS